MIDAFWSWLIFIVLFVSVALLYRLHWRCRSDNGYNMGKNYMHELGFNDDDIKQGKDDEDEKLYIFREQNNKNKDDRKS